LIRLFFVDGEIANDGGSAIDVDDFAAEFAFCDELLFLLAVKA
jgi:hypothetical protein